MDPAPIRLDGDVAVVTGAGHGLGRAYALELATRGASVVCNDVVGEAAAATADEITRRGGTAVPESSSVATPAGGEAIVERAIDAFGAVDVVVNNAGQLRNAAFEDLTVDDIDAVLQTHLAGAFYVTQPAYRHMQRSGYGRILFTSSSAGLFGSPWQAPYAAAKAGLIGLCNVVALEGADHGIKANAIMPMALTGIGASQRPALPPDELRETARVLQPLVPHMTVENVAPLVVYLASRRCAPTQRVFSVGCGHVARVFVAVNHGWYASGPGMTPEVVEANLDAVGEPIELAFPGSMNEATRLVAQHLPRPG